MACFQGRFEWQPFVFVGGGGMVSVAALVWALSRVSMNIAAVAMLQRDAAVDSGYGVDATTGRRLLRKLRTLRSVHRLLLKLQGQSMDKLEQFVAGLPEERTPESAYRFRPEARRDATQSADDETSKGNLSR